jgi:DNA-binding response OmpR family regulator
MAYLIIVDDDEEFASAAAIALRKEGHEVARGADSETAIAMMKDRRPDLVILDVMFPGDDFAGFDLARAMHQCDGLDRVPILMLTGVNARFSIDFSKFDIDNSWLPVSDFLDKPVDFTILAAKVKSLLAAGSAPRGAAPAKRKPASDGA